MSPSRIRDGGTAEEGTLTLTNGYLLFSTAPSRVRADAPFDRPNLKKVVSVP
jgi:hypothetical protein